MGECSPNTCTPYAGSPPRDCSYMFSYLLTVLTDYSWYCFTQTLPKKTSGMMLKTYICSKASLGCFIAEKLIPPKFQYITL